MRKKRPTIVIVHPETGFYLCKDYRWREVAYLSECETFKYERPAEKLALSLSPIGKAVLIYVYEGYELGLHGDVIRTTN